MILPNKHIRLSESLIGLSSFVLKNIKEPTTLDDIWKKVQESVSNKRYPFSHSFENVILSVDLLMILGAVETNSKGKIVLCNS